MKGTALGEYLRRVRAAKGYSARKLAALARVDHSWLSHVERGDYPSPDPRLLQRVATALDLETADLYLQAGYGDARGLPGLMPYLRAKYDLPAEAIAQLEAHFDLINEKYQAERKDAA